MQMRHVQAAAELVEAMTEFDNLVSEAQERHTTPHFYFKVAVYEADGDSGGSTHAWALLPLEMCEPVVAMLRELTVGQLKALGVDTSPPLSDEGTKE